MNNTFDLLIYDKLKQAVQTLERNMPNLQHRAGVVRRLARLDQQLAEVRDDLKLCDEDSK